MMFLRNHDRFKEIYGIITLSVIAFLIVIIVVMNGMYTIRIQELNARLETSEREKTDEYQKLLEEREDLVHSKELLETKNREIQSQLEDALQKLNRFEGLEQEFENHQRDKSFLEEALKGYRMAYERVRSLKKVTGTYNGTGESHGKVMDILEDNRLYTFSDDEIYNVFTQSVEIGDRVTLLYYSGWGRNQIIGFYPEKE
jgi:hypothetical protein